MCGLFGAISLTRGATISSNLVKRNACEMDTRGGHSVGWCRTNDNQVEYWKHKGLASEFKKGLKSSVFQANSVIGHTRYATHGSVDKNINNHPHVYWNSSIVGAVTHNGVIGDHLYTAKKNKLKLKGECDSEIIARLVESYSMEYSLVERVAMAVNECDGSDTIALSVIETGQGTSDMVLVARGNPIWYSVKNGVLYYASTNAKLPKNAVQLEEGSIMHIREHVGILDTYIGMMEKYNSYSYLNRDWRTYGSSKKSTPSLKPKPLSELKEENYEIDWGDEFVDEEETYNGFNKWLTDRQVK